MALTSRKELVELPLLPLKISSLAEGLHYLHSVASADMTRKSVFAEAAAKEVGSQEQPKF